MVRNYDRINEALDKVADDFLRKIDSYLTSEFIAYLAIGIPYGKEMVISHGAGFTVADDYRVKFDRPKFILVDC